MEMMTRGVDGNSIRKLFQVASGAPYIGVLDSQSSQNLSMLRVLSESILTYTSIITKSNDIGARLSARVVDFLNCVLWGLKSDGDVGRQDASIPALSENPFSLLVEASFMIVPASDLDAPGDVLNVIKIFWMLEVVKSICAVIESVGVKGDAFIEDERLKDCEGVDAGEMGVFVDWIMLNLKIEEGLRAEILAKIPAAFFLAFSRGACLQFLRRVCILLYARFAMVSPCLEDKVHLVDGEEVDPAEESSRLCEYLQLPSVVGICGTETMNDPVLSKMISGWCNHLTDLNPGHFTDEDKMIDDSMIENDRLLSVGCPAVMTLIALPKQLDVLFEESRIKTCERCGTIPQTPALCLICGVFVCSQSFCCTDGETGECNAHARVCGGDIGIFFIIKRSLVLLLHNENGCYMNPMYLDAHGEVDIGLRRGNVLKVNAKRYGELRRIWLGHGVASGVARKVEQTFDFGGWGTV
jgi:E3 ubiquitin-protein ligase UBR1